MSEKKTFVLRIDAKTYEAIEKWAGDEFRSVNGQLEWIIHQALKSSSRMPKKEDVEKKGKKDSI